MRDDEATVRFAILDGLACADISIAVGAAERVVDRIYESLTDPKIQRALRTVAMAALEDRS